MLLSGRSRSMSLSALRWRARAPRLAFTSVCMILSLVGLRVVLAGPPKPLAAPKGSVASTSDVEGFAEGFARAFLTFSPQDPGRRDRAMKLYGYVSDDAVTGTGATHVVWTSVVDSQARHGGGRVVTVLADDGRREWYLAVTVTLDRSGRRSIATAPALVGPPATRPDAVAPAELEVDDRGLRQVAERVVRHFLAGDQADLAADLARGATVTTPPVAARLASVDVITWVARPSRIAVAVTASAPDHLHFSLRYELQVIRLGGRWLVREVQVNPLDREGTR
ncbi:MAG: hypothetical protein JWR63_1390 [Conexibacter sp.]|nr:hypothetical protein [Conexibacter sp.]